MQKKMRNIYVLGFMLAGAFLFTAFWVLRVDAAFPDGSLFQSTLTLGDGPEEDWEIYTTIDDVSGIAPDGNIIWAATSGGLFQWERDTGNLNQYLASQYPLPSNYLGDVLLHKGNLYIGGHGGLSVFDRGDNWTLYTSEDIGLEVGYSSSMAIVDDVLWLEAEGGIGQLFPDGHWEIIRAGENTFSIKYIRKIVPLEDGVYVVGTMEGLATEEPTVVRFSDGVWEVVNRPLMSYFEAPGGSLWKRENGVLFKSSDQAATWSEIAGTNGFIYPRAFDEQGWVYASGDDKILVIEDDQVIDSFCFSDVMPELNYINIIEWDNAGRMWVATDGQGVTMFDGEYWRNWQEGMSGMRGDAVRGMAVGEDKFYAGTHDSVASGGVNVFDFETEQWSNFWPDESELSGGGVDGIAIDSHGRVYFPTSENILDIYDGETWEHVTIPLPEGLIAGTTEGAFDKDGNYWLAVDGYGLWMYDGSGWSVYSFFARTYVNCLKFDQQGRLWLGTPDGLLVRDLDARWLFYAMDVFSIEDTEIDDVVVDHEGRVWMVGKMGLLVFNGQEFQAFDPALASASGWGRALAVDPNGDLWVDIENGLAVFRGEPAIDGFISLTLEPTSSIPEEDIVQRLEAGEIFSNPTMPYTSSSPSPFLSLTLVVFFSLTCLLPPFIAFGVYYFFIPRKRSDS